ncbi:MAG: hypothetical protein ACI8UZ_000400 [Akkermansiaceae bacterium]|jgi:hypothetical protein
MAEWKGAMKIPKHMMSAISSLGQLSHGEMERRIYSSAKAENHQQGVL